MTRAPATPDTVGAVDAVETVYATVTFFANRLETPLDDGVERLGPRLYHRKLCEFC